MLKVSACALLLSASAPVVLAQTTTTSPSPPAANSSATDGSGTTSAAGKMSDQEVKTQLESQGYSGVRDIKSTAEGISAKAMKDGRDVSLSIDSNGKVKER